MNARVKSLPTQIMSLKVFLKVRELSYIFMSLNFYVTTLSFMTYTS